MPKKTTDTSEDDTLEVEVKTVRMVRKETGEEFADVHPDEVENYAVGGWSKVKE